MVRQIIVPVATDALDRSLMLAAAMDARGHGRRVTQRRAAVHVTGGALVLIGLCGVCLGIYGLLDASTARILGLSALFGGLTSAAVGFVIGGRQVHTTRYRPDPWLAPEWAVAASGIFVAAALFFTGSVNPDALNPSLQPLQWPTLPLLPFLAILAGALPAWLAPPVQARARRDPSGTRSVTAASAAEPEAATSTHAGDPPKVPA